MPKAILDQAIRHARGHPETPCAEALAMIFLGAQYKLPFLLNQCQFIVDATLPGLTMSLIRELAQPGQEESLREIAEEMRRDFPSVWVAGMASKAISEQRSAFSPAKGPIRRNTALSSRPLH
jgi:hypothetical protein